VDIVERVRRFVWFAGFAAVCLLLSAWLGILPHEDTNGYLRDLVRLTYQFLLLVVIGGWVALEFRRFSDRQQLLEDYKREAVELSRGMIAAYNQGKRVRRFLRARAKRVVTRETGERQVSIRASTYDELMGELCEVQLSLEAYCKRLRSEQHLFENLDGDLYEGLVESVRSMEGYLNSLITEWESALYEFDKEPEYLSLEELPKLRGFIALEGIDDDLRDKVFGAFRQALNAFSKI
jgi:hypothetical protein